MLVASVPVNSWREAAAAVSAAVARQGQSPGSVTIAPPMRAPVSYCIGHDMAGVVRRHAMISGASCLLLSVDLLVQQAP